jgi:hypothetical protein
MNADSSKFSCKCSGNVLLRFRKKQRAAFSVKKHGIGGDLSFPFGPELEAAMMKIRKEAQ